MANRTPTQRLFLDADTGATETAALGVGQVAVFSRQGPGDGPNEDAAAIIELDPQRSVLAVADGVGGLPAGEDAAGEALQVLHDTLIERCANGRELREAVLDGFEAANAAILDHSGGTTLAVAAICRDELRTFHVGDSAILLVGQRGRQKFKTLDHSPVGYALEAGVIDEEQALVHDERHLLSNMLGDRDMKIEIGPIIRMAVRDTLLLGTDGLFDNLRVDEINDAIRCGPLPAAVQQIVATCGERMDTGDDNQPGKLDDLTFVLFRPGHQDRGHSAAS